MEPIDFAAEQLRVITADIQAYRGTVVTEQDTRLKIINRVLTEVLRWSHADIATEEQAGDGYLDYKLMVDGLARLIVEAKRDARSLGLSTQTPGRAYKLNGPVFRTESVREGIAQAIRYCGQKNAELACVTNGHEWVVFRGSRLGDGHDTMEGRAFVFPSLDAVQAHFALFYSLLSSAAVRAFQYRAHFQEVEGRLIRTHEFRRALRPADSRRLVGHGPLAGDLERVMLSFFRRISGEDDPDLLAQCFVVTTESQRADETLARISEDLIRRIRTLETGNAEELTRLIERVKQTQRNEFVLLVGTKGAGKSTFIDRFFRYVLPRQLLDDCLVVKINLADSEGDDAGVPTWLNHHLLHALEQAIFGEDAPTYEELQGMFYDEYTRWRKGTLRPLYEQNKAQFQIEFGHHIERRREERPHEYIERLLAHVVSLRRKLPCIIFDNADHFTIEFQERVFQYARSLYEKQICLVIMPITDRTSWHLSREGALRSFEG